MDSNFYLNAVSVHHHKSKVTYLLKNYLPYIQVVLAIFFIEFITLNSMVKKSFLLALYL